MSIPTAEELDRFDQSLTPSEPLALRERAEAALEDYQQRQRKQQAMHDALTRVNTIALLKELLGIEVPADAPGEHGYVIVNGLVFKQEWAHYDDVYDPRGGKRLHLYATCHRCPRPAEVGNVDDWLSLGRLLAKVSQQDDDRRTDGDVYRVCKEHTWKQRETSEEKIARLLGEIHDELHEGDE